MNQPIACTPWAFVHPKLWPRIGAMRTETAPMTPTPARPPNRRDLSW